MKKLYHKVYWDRYWQAHALDV